MGVIPSNFRPATTSPALVATSLMFCHFFQPNNIQFSKVLAMIGWKSSPKVIPHRRTHRYEEIPPRIIKIGHHQPSFRPLQSPPLVTQSSWVWWWDDWGPIIQLMQQPGLMRFLNEFANHGSIKEFDFLRFHGLWFDSSMVNCLNSSET